MSAAADLSNSVVRWCASVYCSGSTDSQLEIRMNTKMVTASGSTNGAIRMPIALSIWLRLPTVTASKNNCTPPGTPDEVTLARRKNASAITITAAIADDRMVSVLTVPTSGQTAVWCSPTSIAASARILSVIEGRPFHALGVPGVQAGLRPLPVQLFYHRQHRAQHQDHLKERQPDNHAQTAVPHEEARDRQCDHGDDQQPGRGVQRHLRFQWVVFGGDRRHRSPHEQRVDQTERQPGPDEHTEQQLAELLGRDHRRRGQRDTDNEKLQRTKYDGGQHQRRVLRWCGHRLTPCPALSSTAAVIPARPAERIGCPASYSSPIPHDKCCYYDS